MKREMIQDICQKTEGYIKERWTANRLFFIVSNKEVEDLTDLQLLSIEHKIHAEKDISLSVKGLTSKENAYRLRFLFKGAEVCLDYLECPTGTQQHKFVPAREYQINVADDEIDIQLNTAADSHSELREGLWKTLLHPRIEIDNFLKECFQKSRLN